MKNVRVVLPIIVPCKNAELLPEPAMIDRAQSIWKRAEYEYKESLLLSLRKDRDYYLKSCIKYKILQ